jgi:hypothetical protein
MDMTNSDLPPAPAPAPAPSTPVVEPEHEHYAISRQGGRRQAIWSTRDECVKCGSGREWR